MFINPKGQAMAKDIEQQLRDFISLSQSMGEHSPAVQLCTSALLELERARDSAACLEADATRYRGLIKHHISNYPAGIFFRVKHLGFATAGQIEAHLDQDLAKRR